jgi:hypothetical protein
MAGGGFVYLRRRSFSAGKETIEKVNPVQIPTPYMFAMQKPAERASREFTIPIEGRRDGAHPFYCYRTNFNLQKQSLGEEIQHVAASL